jgi:hypothetical protein
LRILTYQFKGAFLRKSNSILILAVTASLAACGGGGGGGSTSSVQQSAEGIWVGSTSSSSGNVIPSIGLVLDTGEYFFGTGTDYSGITFGTLTVSGSTVSSTNMKDYSPQLNALINGSFTGTVTSGSTMSVNISEVYNGTTYTGTGSFTFDPKYNEQSSLATIAGRYVHPNAFGGAYNYTVDANGVLSGATTKCTISGQLSLRNSSKNVYNLSLTTRNAPGQTCPAGQQTLSGAATYAVMPNRTARSLVLIALSSIGNSYYNWATLAGERQ